MVELTKTTNTALQAKGVTSGLDEVSDLARGVTITLEQRFPMMVYVIRQRGRETFVYLDKGSVVSPKGGDRTWQSVVETVRFGPIGATWAPSEQERRELKKVIEEGIPANWVLNHPEVATAKITFSKSVTSLD